jgi:GWxTD domain-containing protein
MLDNLNQRQRIFSNDKRSTMPFFHFTKRAAVLLFPLFCAEPFLAQEKPPHACFEQPYGALDAIHRLPSNDRYWLQEDAVYIITPEERCAFLHLETHEEREQFMEQFWFRRASDPDSPDNEFKIEYYRRIAFANEKFGGQLAGWKTDRGRIYVLFGPPDSVELHESGERTGIPSGQGPETYVSPTQEWHYPFIKGIGEKVLFDFEYSPINRDYLLVRPASDPDRLLRAEVSHLPHTNQTSSGEMIDFHVGPMPVLKIRSKDMEAVLVSRIVRDQVKFSYRVEFSPATHASTLVRIDIQIPCDTCAHDGQIDESLAYPLFIRVSKPSGWVVGTSELTADIALRASTDSRLTLGAHLDVPLAPGTYQLAVVAKNAATGEVGVVREQLDVPTYGALETKYWEPHHHSSLSDELRRASLNFILYRSGPD